MSRPSPVRLPALMLVLAGLLAACGASRPITYYTLTPLLAPPAASQPGRPLPAAFSLGIGPVTLPESLVRSQIALRLDNQRLRYEDQHRWGGSLAEDFSEVLTQDLVALLPTGTPIVLFPWQGQVDPDHRLQITVSRFDGRPGDVVSLTARWSLSRDRQLLVSRQSAITVPVVGQEIPDLVAAQSQAVAQLAREIAAALPSP